MSLQQTIYFIYFFALVKYIIARLCILLVLLNPTVHDMPVGEINL
jgi:hypothetical protein